MQENLELAQFTPLLGILILSSGKLLLTEEKWAARMKEKSREASSHRGGDCKRSGKASSKKKKVDPNACRRCGKTGRWTKECSNRKQEKKAEAHLA